MSIDANSRIEAKLLISLNFYGLINDYLNERFGFL